MQQSLYSSRKIFTCFAVHFIRFVEDQKVRVTVLDHRPPLDELKLVTVAALRLLRIDHAMTRSVVLTAASCRGTLHPRMLGNHPRPRAMSADRRSQLGLRRRPDSDR